MEPTGRLPDVRFARTTDDALASRALAPWRVKAAAMRFERERRQELVVGGLLAEMLAEHGVTAPRFVVSPLGKPMLADGVGLHFSLSHSDDVVMVAVADLVIGCDVEKIVTEPTRNVAFFERWTRREAGLKMLGCGFADGASADAPPHPESQNVPAPEGFAAAVCCPGSRAGNRT